LKASEITIDHILPVSRGGTNDVENLCVSCGPCNGRKRDKVIAPPGKQTEKVIIVRPRYEQFDVAGEPWVVVPMKLARRVL
jgi:5-methylcytosine-specific restriction endonuclease McrA